MELERIIHQREKAGFLRNDETFDFPAKREVVRGATIERVVDGEPDLVPHFIEAARKLEGKGVKAIVGDCGSIATYQRAIANAVAVPFISSSLLLVLLVHRLLSENQKVGIITAESD